MLYSWLTCFLNKELMRILNFKAMVIFTFKKSSLKMIFYYGLIFVYETDLWLRAETTNEKLKQDAKTQYADVKQAMSVLCIMQLKATSKKNHVS